MQGGRCQLGELRCEVGRCRLLAPAALAEEFGHATELGKRGEWHRRLGVHQFSQVPSKQSELGKEDAE